MPLFCFILTYFDDARFVNSCENIFANNRDDHIRYFWNQQPEFFCSILKKKNCGLNFRITLHLSPSLYTLWTLLQTSSNIFMKKYELCWSLSLPTGPNPWKSSGSLPHNVNILRPVLLCRTGWETFRRFIGFPSSGGSIYWRRKAKQFPETIRPSCGSGRRLDRTWITPRRTQ